MGKKKKIVLTEKSKLIHCGAALVVADSIFECAALVTEIRMEDHRKDYPNPVYHQTAQGLLLELWGARPVSVITPWGEYYFSGSYSFSQLAKAEIKAWNIILKELKTRLNLNLYKPKSEIAIDTIRGDLFRIKSFDDFSLPCVVERVYSDYESFEKAGAEWGRLIQLVQKNKH